MPEASALERITTRKPNVEELEDKLLNPPAEGPTPVSTPSRPRGRERKPAVDQLAGQYVAPPITVPCNTRIPQWLDEEVNRKIRELQGKGAKKITKQVILTEALKAYLDVDEPA